MRRRTKIIVGVSVALVLLAGAAATSVFGGVSVCRDCGVLRYERRWQLPRSNGWSYAVQYREKETPVSAMLAKEAQVVPHAHRWLFAHGGGNGVKCALGHGSVVIFFSMDPEMAQRLERLRLVAESEFFRQVVRASLCPWSCPEMTNALRDLSDGREMTPMQFNAWKKRNKEGLDKAFENMRAYDEQKAD